MPLLYPANPERCRILTIEKEDHDSGPRLGGRAPAGVQPSTPRRDYRYFFTLPVSSAPELELTVFLALPFQEMVGSAGRLYRGHGVDVVFHGPSARGGDETWASELSPHAMTVLAEKDDWFIEEGEKIIESRHKMGGRPFLIQEESAPRKELSAAFGQGFRQITQLDMPAEVPVKGRWPFGNGMFHLIGRNLLRKPEWAAFWEFG